MIVHTIADTCKIIAQLLGYTADFDNSEEFAVNQSDASVGEEDLRNYRRPRLNCVHETARTGLGLSMRGRSNTVI